MLELTERERLVAEQIKEEFLLNLPALIGNLIADHAARAKMNSQFYKDHPEFAGHKDIVASVVEMVDGQDTLADYNVKLDRAVPLIQERLKITSGLDTTSAKPPSRDFSHFKGSNGEL